MTSSGKRKKSQEKDELGEALLKERYILCREVGAHLKEGTKHLEEEYLEGLKDTNRATR